MTGRGNSSVTKAQVDQMQKNIEQLGSDLKGDLVTAFAAFSKEGGKPENETAFEQLLLQIVEQILSGSFPITHFAAACHFLKITPADEKAGQCIADVLWMAGIQVRERTSSALIIPSPSCCPSHRTRGLSPAVG